MKCLITGAPGWLGTRFVQALCGKIPELREIVPAGESDEIRCLVYPGLDAGPLSRIDPRVRIVPGDLTDRNSLAPFFAKAEGAVLFHLAGIIHPKRIAEFYRINVEGMRRLLELASEQGLRRLIAVSSNSPAGNNPRSDHRFSESSPYRPYMNYGRSKMQMEELVNDSFRTGRLETVLLRPCWFYGPCQPPRQTLFFSMVKNGKAPIVGDGENRRSMSYVDNTAQALLLASTSAAASGQTYWIADRHPYSMNEIVDTIERLLEKEFRIPVAHKRLRLPSAVSGIAGLCDGLLQAAGIYQQKIHVLSEMNKTIACSIAKAEKELGYKPRVELEEGMRRSIRWCLENGLKI